MPNKASPNPSEGGALETLKLKKQVFNICTCIKLINVNTVEECDARDDDSSNVAD